MRVAGENLAALADAFAEALQTHDRLNRVLVISFSTPLNSVVGPGKPLPAAALDVILWAEAKDELEALIEGTCREIPGNPKLRDVAARVRALLVAVPVVQPPPPGPAGRNGAGGAPPATAQASEILVHHSRADKWWVETELLVQFHGASVKAYQAGTVPPAPDDDRALRDAVGASRFVIVVLTDEWCASSWPTFEPVLPGLLDPAAGEGRLILLQLEQCPVPAPLGGLPPIDFVNPELRGTEGAVRLFKRLGRSDKEVNELITCVAEQGIKALAELMRTEQARDAVRGSEATFNKAKEQIEVLYRWKRLHDLFQCAVWSHRLIQVEKKALLKNDGDPEERWEHLDTYMREGGLGPWLRKVIDYATEVLEPDERLWTATVQRGLDELRLAIPAADLNRLKNATQRLQQVFEIVPARANEKMVGAVRSLALGELVKHLRTVKAELDNKELGLEAGLYRRKFGDSIGAMERLGQHLTNASRTHNALQEIDNLLQTLDATSTVEDVENVWPDLAEPTDLLGTVNGGPWVDELKRLDLDVSRAVQTAKAAPGPRAAKAVHKLLSSYRETMRQGFDRNDKDLKDFCERLKGVGETLSEILGRMAQ